MPRSRNAPAFTVMELMVAVACVILLVSVFLPALARSKARSSKINCTSNVKQNGIAFRTWALDNHDRYPMGVSVDDGGTMELGASGVVFPHFQVMSNELSTPKLLICPEDKQRTSAANFTSGMNDTNLSYFVGLDSVPGGASSILSGDRNLTNQPAPGSRLLTLRAGSEIGWNKEMHNKRGNILFGDGSANQFANGQSSRSNQWWGSGTKRLAVP